jgi:L-iditol 2-dehydrogenase
MKLATWRGGDRFSLDEAPDPAAGPGEVVVDVQAAGICGTDVHATQGLFPWSPPMVLGHEYTGIVRDVGRGVSRRLLGRLVGCEPSYGCGHCVPCAEGRVTQCPDLTRVGGFAERARLPVECVHLLPRGLDAVTATLTEPAACCLAGLESFRMPRDATVVVIGGGVMGLLTMALARRRGARRLVLSDPIAERRDAAKTTGRARPDRSEPGEPAQPCDGPHAGVWGRGGLRGGGQARAGGRRPAAHARGRVCCSSWA